MHANISEANRETFDDPEVVAAYAYDTRLQPAEKRIIDSLGEILSRARLLDIGVGAGRTSEQLIGKVAEYTGVDYSQNMIEQCERRFANHGSNARFLVCDVREMTMFADKSFDIAAFSFNGIDCMEHADRLRALREIHRVCNPGSAFWFSSHNIRHIPSYYAVSSTANARAMASALLKLWRYVRRNGRLSSLKLESREHVIIFDEAHDWRLAHYYISAEGQVRQLQDCGFTNVRVFGGASGSAIIAPSEFPAATNCWLYYLCTRD